MVGAFNLLALGQWNSAVAMGLRASQKIQGGEEKQGRGSILDIKPE